MKKILFAFACILALVFAMSVTGFAATTESNAYADTLDVVEGVPVPSIIDENARAVVVVNGTYYTIPTYYLIADNAHFTWSVHANVKTALGLGSDVRSNLVRIEIPEGIETSHNGGDGGKKLESSTNLIEASIPTSMKIMGDYFFGKCTSLTTVNGLENSQVDGIYKQAFYNTKITSIALPSTVTTIETEAFKNVPITSVVIPDNVENIGDHAFASCTSLATITISENSKLKTFSGEYQFEQTAITSFYFPSTLESLGKGGAFFKCGSLATLINFENTKIEDIPYRTFAKDGKGPIFTSITFPQGLKTIGASAFGGHVITGDIILPNSVTSIGDHAFAGSNVQMGKLVLGAGLTTITGTYTFEKSDFKEIYIPAGVTAFPQGAFKETLGSGAVYYFTGTKAQLETLISSTASSDNGTFTGAKIASLAEYNTATDKTSKNYIVYGYSACEAFYNGAHNEADTVNGSACYLKDCSRCDVGELYIGGDINSGKHSLTVTYEYANGYMQDGQIVSICGNAGCTHGTKDTAFTSPLEALFNGLAYSIAENGTGICVKYNINKEAVESYKESGKAISFGVIAIMSDKIGDGDVLYADGTKKTASNVVLANLTNEGVSSVTLKIVSSKETWIANNAKSIYLLGYATNGEALEYLGEASEGATDRDNIASVKAVSISTYFPTPQEGGNA